MKDHAQLAFNNFKSGYNCAQAVACAFSEELGIDEPTLARMTSSFGGGMGKLREVCGAVSGALFVLGTLQGYSEPTDDAGKAAHYARVQDFAFRFKQQHESIICRDLLNGIALKKEHTPAPEARSDEYYRTRPCVRFVETAAKIVEDMLAE